MSGRRRQQAHLSACRPVRKTAFSLLELMIATVILGFGLLMIGAVLPIAWQSSLDSAAQTRADGATDVARYTIQAKALADSLANLFDADQEPVNGPDDVPDSKLGGGDGTSYTLFGDYDTLAIDWVNQAAGHRARVHALHMENWAMAPDSAFVFGDGAVDRRVPEAPICIASPRGDDPTIVLRVGLPAKGWGNGLCPAEVGRPTIELAERVYPPMPADLTPVDQRQWRDLLDDRAFAWAALHRLLRVPDSPVEPRHFLMYYVTLRRGGSTSRFARQDPQSRPGSGTELQALSDSEDVMFPIAWRVPLVILESNWNNTVVPTEAIAFAGLDTDPANDLVAGVVPQALLSDGYLGQGLQPVDNELCRVAEMFPRGSVFIDEENGNVYRVNQRQFIVNATGRDDELARLTLDREVLRTDLDPDHAGGAPYSVWRRSRIVWVFPPSAEPGQRGASSGGVKFTGTDPVVDIRLEPLTLMP